MWVNLYKCITNTNFAGKKNICGESENYLDRRYDDNYKTPF